MNRYINHLTVHPLYRWLSARLQNFIANTLELLRSCTKPSIYTGHKPSQGCAYFMLTPRPSICKILIPPMFCTVSWAIIDSINRIWPCKSIPNDQLFYVTFVSKKRWLKSSSCDSLQLPIWHYSSKLCSKLSNINWTVDVFFIRPNCWHWRCGSVVLYNDDNGYNNVQEAKIHT